MEGEAWAASSGRPCSHAGKVARILAAPFDGFEAAFVQRIGEANEFFDAIQPKELDADTRLIQRQAYAGLYVGSVPAAVSTLPLRVSAVRSLAP